MQPTTWDQLIAGSGLPRLDARALLAAIAACRPEWLIAHGDEPVPEAVAQRFADQAAARRAGQPLAYLTGMREFYGRPFHVTSAVLIPRQDTECLIEVALERLAGIRSPRVIDLGTGSGVIAVTLALERPDAQVVATDRSAAALAVARQNARALGADRIDFRAGDWWDALTAPPTSDTGAGPAALSAAPAEALAKALARAFDVAVSNPPYIAPDDPHLDQGDLRFEPRAALAADRQGMADIERIIAGAGTWLRPSGWLLLEHGFDQSEAVRQRLADAGFEQVATRRDLEQRDRVSLGQRPRGADGR